MKARPEETTRAPGFGVLPAGARRPSRFTRRRAGAVLLAGAVAAAVWSPWMDAPPRACAAIDRAENVVAWTVGDDAPTMTSYRDEGDRLAYASSMPPAATAAVSLALARGDDAACIG